MKNALFALVLLAACGAPGTEIAPTEDIGTAAKPVFMPVKYGFEGGDGERCSPPWQGGICWVPDNTGDNVFIRVWIDDASCTDFNGFFKDRIHHAFDIVRAKVVAQGIQMELMPTKLDARFVVKCGTNATAYGRFSPVSTEPINTVNGTLAQYGSGTTTIDQAKIEATACFSTGTLQKQVDFSENVIQHEFWHILGIGHEKSPGGNGITLMDPTYDGSVNKATCTGFVNLNNSDLAAIDCYNATSGTGDRCAD